MAELHETMMGKKLITSDIPRLITNIEKLGGILEKINVTLEDMYDILLEFKTNQNERINK
jgi:ATP-dependent Zn protease